jgi:hypothetical protein
MHRRTVKELFICLLIFHTLSIGQGIGAQYLIITHDDFYKAVLPFAQWKIKKGVTTKVIKLSEIGSDSTQIRNYILNAYNTWIIKPEYLLLVGAHNFIPFFHYSEYSTDNYYTNMDEDIYNEILSGRLTVHDLPEAENVINKILLYEKMPYIGGDILWFTNACLIVREDYDSDDVIYWGDINYTKNLLVNNGYNIIDTLSWSGGDDKLDVITSVNEGRAFVLYRGTGSNNWLSPFNLEPDSLENGLMFPIVLSMTCLTIGTWGTPATAEKWFLTGTAEGPKGAVAYFAPTTGILNGAHLRSAATRGFFNALFIDKKTKLSEACEAGRLNVYQLYPTASGLKEYKGLTLLGDPEMDIWTSMPKLTTVIHDSTLYVGNETLNVQVMYLGEPVESAYVCIMYDTLIYETGYTDETGNISFELYLPGPGNLELTITGHNLYPKEITIPVAILSIDDDTSWTISSDDAIFVQPNPFSYETRIHYSLSQPTKIEIFDCVGKRVRQFVPDGSSGIIKWRGDDDFGNYLPAGIYFVCFEAGEYNTEEKIVLLR